MPASTTESLSQVPTEPNAVTDSLPMVLLGIRTALKDDIHCTAAELVYGTTLRLPGVFFDSTNDEAAVDPTSYVARLKSSMQQLKAIPVHPQPPRNVYVSNNLLSCTHVFFRRDAVRKPLQQPYDGPFKVLKRTEKHFTIAINGRKVISCDRLKPAHLDSTPEMPSYAVPTATTNDPGARTTHSGRHVHWPQRLSC